MALQLTKGRVGIAHRKNYVMAARALLTIL